MASFSQELKPPQNPGRFTFRFGGLVLLASNEALQTTDYTSALERRRLTVEFKRLVSDTERADWNARGGEEAILHREIAGVANWVLGLSREDVTRRLTRQPRRVAQSNREALRNNNPVADWLIENTIPEPRARVRIGDHRPITEHGRTWFEHADEWLYPNYLTWCHRAKREPLALRRFSSLAVDMARSLGVDVLKSREGSGVHLQGLRLRSESETPHDWLDMGVSDDDDPIKSAEPRGGIDADKSPDASTADPNPPSVINPPPYIETENGAIDAVSVSPASLNCANQNGAIAAQWRNKGKPLYSATPPAEHGPDISPDISSATQAESKGESSASANKAPDIARANQQPPAASSKRPDKSPVCQPAASYPFRYLVKCDRPTPIPNPSGWGDPIGCSNCGARWGNGPPLTEHFSIAAHLSVVDEGLA
ncbi:MAG: hypothetical protein H6972_10560 [Gammaproteobacteria bacterium]|nr:hypothetical protein [Gammaproteobacteria bacterium]